MKQLLATLFLYLLFCIGVQAQQPMLRNFRADDYRGGTQNWAIDITASKRIVMANNEGLLRYDSRWWRQFPLPNYSNVRSILYDSLTNYVWAGGTDEFGCFEYDSHLFSHYHSVSERLPEADRQFGEIWNIMRCGTDFVFQAKNQLFFLHKDSTLTTLRVPFSIDCSAIVDGRLLVADETGIFVVGTNQQLTPLPGMEALQGKIVRAILKTEPGSLAATGSSKALILCTATDGLFLYDGQETRPFCQDLTPFLTENQLFCADLQGDLLALGTVRNGLVLRNLSNGATQYANTATGLQDNTVLSLRFDAMDNVWLGLDQGAAYVMTAFPATYLLGNHSPIGTGYASAVYGDNLYLGTNQGLFTIPYPIPDTPTPPTPQLVNGMAGQIWSLQNIGGTLLCGADGGAYVIHGQQASKIAGVDGTWCFLPLRQHPQYVLGCDYKGLFLLHATDHTFAGRIQGFAESSNNIYEDAEGNIWISHWRKGIFRITLSTDAQRVEHTVLFNKDNGLYLDEYNLLCQVGGRILVSSVDGFYSYNEATGQMQKDERMNQVFNTYGTPLRLFETPRRDLCAFKKDYLALARRQSDGTYVTDTLSYKGVAGELQVALGHPSFLNYGDQTVLNSLNGFIAINNQGESLSQETRLKIETIEGTNRGDTLLYACGVKDDLAYSVSPNDNSLRITFIMPEYMRPDETLYSCLLEGYDQEWSQWQTANTKEYTQLPKGRYTFRVKARNRLTGYEDERSIQIEVLPAWYETWWAYLVYLLLACAAAYAIYRWAKRQQDKRLRALEARKEEEMRRQQKQFELEQKQKDLELREQQAHFELEQQRKDLELREQQARFEVEQQRQENEMARIKNEQLETELKHRQSELADSTMNLMRKNDMLQALDQQMSELSESVRREDLKARITQKIKDIRHDIQQNINEDEGWDKFEENFNLVYDNFMVRLLARFPDLKMNDRKLCAYLRMGLSSKEMASLLNTSVRSIETARYRLRKKLSMEQGDNLAEFIQSFEA